MRHLSPAFRAQTMDLIAQVLFSTDTPTDTPAPGAEDTEDDGPETLFPEGKVGGVDGTRTPSVSEVKRERFTPASEAPLVTRNLVRDGVAGESLRKKVGGVDGTRTRDLRRDRPAF